MITHNDDLVLLPYRQDSLYLAYCPKGEDTEVTANSGPKGVLLTQRTIIP